MGVKYYGQWNEVRKLLGKGNLGYVISHAYHIAAYSQAEAIRRNIIQNIEGQAYNHTPLKPKYKEWKIKKGLDPRILIATGSYINAIEVFKGGKNTWCVGIKKGKKNKEGIELRQIGKWLEYGTKHIPARPHWRIEMAKVKRRMQYRTLEILKKNLGGV